MAKTFVRHAVEAHDREVRPQCHLRVDGVEALACLEGNLPDLVLLDVNMPRMDGYEVCREIRSNPAAQNLPVVMISGKDGFFDKVWGRRAGTTGYVTKPFGPETLMKALETTLSRRVDPKLDATSSGTNGSLVCESPA